MRSSTVNITETGNPPATLTYGYDRNGNTLSVTDSTAPDETMGFVYNPRDQLVQVTRGPPGAEVVLGRYDYDAQGQRIRTEALGDPTELVYDGLALLQTYKGASEEAFVHRGPGGELLGVEAPGTPMQWVHTDALGSPTVRTNNSGAVVASTRYGVFGDVASREETDVAQGPRFGFTGHQYDAGSELVYANARYYQPTDGRFLTQDAFLGEVGTPASLHRYAYGHQNPQRYTDPDGRRATAVGFVGGFFWGFEQMATALYRDVKSSRSRSFWEYMGLWGRNIYGGTALGASIDLAAVPGLSGAAGLAGLEAMTHNAEAGTYEDFVRNNNRAALEGAALDVVFRVGFFAAPFVVAGGGRLAMKVPGVPQALERGGQIARPIVDAVQTKLVQPLLQSRFVQPFVERGGRFAKGAAEAIRGLSDDVMRALQQPSSRGAPHLAVEASRTGERAYVRGRASGAGALRGSEEGAAALQARSAELQASRTNAWMRDRGTTAAIRVQNTATGEAKTLIATEARTRPAGLTLRAGEEFVEGVGHAEATILRSLGPEWRVVEGGTSRNVCLHHCAWELGDSGVGVGGTKFRGQADKTGFRMFWNMDAK